MQIHNLKYDTEASVAGEQLRLGSPISTGNVTLLGNAAAYGGIGGGFHTLQMTMNLPAGAVTAGSNTVTFRFNQTDGRVSAFRVLAFNIEAADGSLLIPASTFTQDDPNTWQPPSTSRIGYQRRPDALAHGCYEQCRRRRAGTHQRPLLWIATRRMGAISSISTTRTTPLRARSMFHGLTAAQGDQIASYIRRLNLPNPGRPWNPPYQPGPGLDSQPVDQWSAGAGLDAVLASDQDLVNELFPGGAQASEFSPTGILNIRETADRAAIARLEQLVAHRPSHGCVARFCRLRC